MKKNLKPKILKLLDRNWRLCVACDKLGVDQSTVWRWRKVDITFAEEIREARYWSLRPRLVAKIRDMGRKVDAQLAQFERAVWR